MTGEFDDLNRRLSRFFDRRVAHARKQLSANGSTDQLPIVFNTIRVLVLNPGDWIGVRNTEMLKTISAIATIAGLESIGDQGDAWDMPVDVKNSLVLKRNDGGETSSIPTPFKAPTRVVVRGFNEMPRVNPGRDRHTGADGDWNGEQTYNVDDM